MGGQRIKQGQEFKKCEAKCRAVRCELDNVGAGALAALGRWGPGEEGRAGPLVVPGEGMWGVSAQVAPSLGPSGPRYSHLLSSLQIKKTERDSCMQTPSKHCP